MSRSIPASDYELVERLAQLLGRLRSRPLTRAEIAEKMEEYAGDRSFHKLRRDLKALGRLGFAVKRDASDETYHLPAAIIETDWSEHELQALAGLRECFSPGMPYADAICALVDKLSAGMDAHALQILNRTPPLKIELDKSLVSHSLDRMLRELDEAIVKNRRVSFKYRRQDSERPTHHADDEPIRLVFQEGHYYLEAFCLKMDRVYDFRVDQIVEGSIQILPHKAVGRRHRRLIGFQYRLSKKLAARGPSTRFAEMDVEPQPDGSMIISAQGDDKFWVIREILRYGEQAEILGPEPVLTKNLIRVCSTYVL